MREFLFSDAPAFHKIHEKGNILLSVLWPRHFLKNISCGWKSHSNIPATNNMRISTERSSRGCFRGRELDVKWMKGCSPSVNGGSKEWTEAEYVMSRRWRRLRLGPRWLTFSALSKQVAALIGHFLYCSVGRGGPEAGALSLPGPSGERPCGAVDKAIDSCWSWVRECVIVHPVSVWKYQFSDWNHLKCCFAQHPVFTFQVPFTLLFNNSAPVRVSYFLSVC